MASEEHEKLREIFLAARELSPEQRGQFLDSACGNGTALRQEIESLLANDSADTPPVLAPTARPGVVSPTNPLAESLLKSIGPYRLLEIIGTGGMGVVYKAEQRAPIRRTVAVKLIKLGYDSREVIARFESERQALARMDHPHIAKVLDAGTDDGGRPYFVMEYVPGHPITKYADENRLSIQQRLELMLQVCDAIGHAHAKSIIHRDIKAGNVLAYSTTDGPRVKVIDFGVAKALTSDRLTDLTFNTVSGQAIGTYENMSPEQADGSPDIDTRTDVYSLGVLLYELLSGSKPFDRSNLAKAAHEEVRRIIREDEPPRPSTQLSSLGENATKVAKARRCELEALTRQLKSELDWIPLKAIRKERDRRYATPQQFSDDIQNYLQEKPLTAAPDSNAYRLAKFARRNRGPIIAGLSIFAILIIAVCVTSAALLAAKKAYGRANEKQIETQNAKDAAEKAGLQTRAALADSEVHRKEAEQQGYNASIAAATTAIEDGQMGLAREWLDGAAMPLRRWEWRYLYARTDGCLAVLRGHTDAVKSIAFSSDGSKLLTRSSDNTARLWDALSGKQLAVFQVSDEKLLDAALSPDGARVITACSHGLVQQWDAFTGKLLRTFRGHTGDVASVAFDKSGGRFVTASADRTARVWSCDSGDTIALMRGHEAGLRSACFSPDSTQVLTVASDKSAREWNSSSGNQLKRIPLASELGLSATFSPNGRRILLTCVGHPAYLWGAGSDAYFRSLFPDKYRNPSNAVFAAFNSDGSQVVTTSGAGCTVWNTYSGQIVTQFKANDNLMNSAAFSKNCTKVVTASDDQTARVWDTATGKELLELRGHEGRVTDAVFSDDGSRVVTSSDDGTARIWDATVARNSIELGGPNLITAAYNADGTRIIGACSDSAARLWDAVSGRQLMILKHTGEGIFGSLWKMEVLSAFFSEDMHRVVTGATDGTARIWDAHTGRRILSLHHSSNPVVAQFSPDGSTILTIEKGLSRVIKVWDSVTGQKLFEIPTASPDRRASSDTANSSLSPDGRYFIASSPFSRDDGVWDVKSGKRILSTGIFAQSSPTVVSSRSTRRAVTISGYGEVHILQMTSGKNELLSLGGHGGPRLENAVLNPEGSMVATSDAYGLIHVWDIASGSREEVLKGHAAPVITMAFSADGNLLASGADDATTRIWDIRSGRQLIVLRGHNASISSVAFSPDGTQLLTTSTDGKARIWDSVSAAERYKATGQPLIPPYDPVDATQPMPATTQSEPN